MSKELLEVKKLNVQLGDDLVLRDLDFKVGKGEFLAILGPNDTGKSTLLKSLLGLLPYKGEIIWHGRPNINYLPERLSPSKFQEYPLSVQEFFKFKKVPDKKIKTALRSVGLKSPGILRKNPGELSAGQFQRMLIAWSLIDDPEVLLLDEPTVGIDIGGEETIYSLLHSFWRKNKLTILLVTHELDIVYAYSTNVLCLRKEKICYGPPKRALTPEALHNLYSMEVKFHQHQA
jgi:zinc transport system ATP-binding protein